MIHQSETTQDAESLDDSPTAFIICSYQGLILELCIRSMKVSVQVTLRMTPNTEMSARSGSSPPWNLRQHHLLEIAPCIIATENTFKGEQSCKLIHRADMKGVRALYMMCTHRACLAWCGGEVSRLGAHSVRPQVSSLVELLPDVPMDVILLPEPP